MKIVLLVHFILTDNFVLSKVVLFPSDLMNTTFKIFAIFMYMCCFCCKTDILYTGCSRLKCIASLKQEEIRSRLNEENAVQSGGHMNGVFKK